VIYSRADIPIPRMTIPIFYTTPTGEYIGSSREWTTIWSAGTSVEPLPLWRCRRLLRTDRSNECAPPTGRWAGRCVRPHRLAAPQGIVPMLQRSAEQFDRSERPQQHFKGHHDWQCRPRGSSGRHAAKYSEFLAFCHPNGAKTHRFHDTGPARTSL